MSVKKTSFVVTVVNGIDKEIEVKAFNDENEALKLIVNSFYASGMNLEDLYEGHYEKNKWLSGDRENYVYAQLDEIQLPLDAKHVTTITRVLWDQNSIKSRVFETSDAAEKAMTSAYDQVKNYYDNKGQANDNYNNVYENGKCIAVQAELISDKNFEGIITVEHPTIK